MKSCTKNTALRFTPYATGLHLLATGVVIHIAAAARPCPTSSTAASSRTSARWALVVLVLHLLQPKHTNDSITNSTTVLRHATSQLVADQSGIEVTKRCADMHTTAPVTENAFPSHHSPHTTQNTQIERAHLLDVLLHGVLLVVRGAPAVLLGALLAACTTEFRIQSVNHTRVQEVKRMGQKLTIRRPPQFEPSTHQCTGTAHTSIGPSARRVTDTYTSTDSHNYPG
jgi:hypothetical protein